MIKGIHHNVYRCRDTEETRAFYEDFLGLPLVAAHEIGHGRALHTFFEMPNGTFLAFFEVPNRPFDFKKQDDFDLHLALEVDLDEQEAWLAKCRAAGLDAGEIKDHKFVRSIYLRDPNGYVIELTARAPKYDELLQPAEAHEKLARWQSAKAVKAA